MTPIKDWPISTRGVQQRGLKERRPAQWLRRSTASKRTS